MSRKSKSDKILVKKMERKQLLVVFTDGSCSMNGRRGAIGGIGIHFPNGELADISKIYSRGPCTNQKTELYAILSALRYINQNLGLDRYNVLIKTDSNYSINCVTTWIRGWIRNGWLNSKGEPVANREYIEAIYRYVQLYDVEFEHVSAHTNSDDPDSIGNEMADTLATRATRKAIEQLKGSKYVDKRRGSKTNRISRTNRTSKASKNSRTGRQYSNPYSYIKINPDDIEVELIDD